MSAQPSSGGSAAGGASGLGAYGGGISLASGLVSAYGSMYAGKSQANALQAQAQLAEQNAQEAEAQGQFDVIKQQINSELKIGAMNANFGASGVSANSGSVQASMIMSTSNSELDRLNILHGADIKAIQYENQASMDQVGAQSALTGSYFQAAGSIMAAGAKAAAFGIAASPQTTVMSGATNIVSSGGVQGGNQWAGGDTTNDYFQNTGKYSSANNLNLSGTIPTIDTNDGTWVSA